MPVDLMPVANRALEEEEADRIRTWNRLTDEARAQLRQKIERHNHPLTQEVAPCNSRRP